MTVRSECTWSSTCKKQTVGQHSCCRGTTGLLAAQNGDKTNGFRSSASRKQVVLSEMETFRITYECLQELFTMGKMCRIHFVFSRVTAVWSWLLYICNCTSSHPLNIVLDMSMQWVSPSERWHHNGWCWRAPSHYINDTHWLIGNVMSYVSMTLLLLWKPPHEPLK